MTVTQGHKGHKKNLRCLGVIVSGHPKVRPCERLLAPNAIGADSPLMETMLAIIAVEALNILLFVFLSARLPGALLLSNLSLRQQLAVYKRRQERPALKNRDGTCQQK